MRWLEPSCTESQALSSSPLAASVLTSPSMAFEAGNSPPEMLVGGVELSSAPMAATSVMVASGGAGGGGGGEGGGGGDGGAGATYGGGGEGNGDGLGGGGGGRGGACALYTDKSATVKYRSPGCGPVSLSVTYAPADVPPQLIRNGPAPTGTLVGPLHLYPRSP